MGQTMEPDNMLVTKPLGILIVLSFLVLWIDLFFQRLLPLSDEMTSREVSAWVK
jgi:hypothetical protein